MNLIAWLQRPTYVGTCSIHGTPQEAIKGKTTCSVICEAVYVGACLLDSQEHLHPQNAPRTALRPGFKGQGPCLRYLGDPGLWAWAYPALLGSAAWGPRVASESWKPRSANGEPLQMATRTAGLAQTLNDRFPGPPKCPEEWPVSQSTWSKGLCFGHFGSPGYCRYCRSLPV